MARRVPNTFRPTTTPDTPPNHAKANPNPGTTPAAPVAGDRLFITNPNVTSPGGTAYPPDPADKDTAVLTYVSTDVR